jgi:hypothetical protein
MSCSVRLDISFSLKDIEIKKRSRGVVGTNVWKEEKKGQLL